MDKYPALSNALQFLIAHGVAVSPDLLAGLEAIGVKTRAVKQAGDMGAINSTYHDAITQALVDYFEGGNMVSARNDFRRAMVEAFGDTFDTAWVDGGAELPIEDDAAEWYASRQDEELAHIDELFQQARELKKEKDFDYFAWATSRADGYTGALGGIYNAGKMLANKYQLLDWIYGDTEHCETCNSLNGQRHQARWYLARNYIPGKPGAGMDCGGYRCQCTLVDKDGNVVSIE